MIKILKIYDIILLSKQYRDIIFINCCGQTASFGLTYGPLGWSNLVGPKLNGLGSLRMQYIYTCRAVRAHRNKTMHDTGP